MGNIEDYIDKIIPIVDEMGEERFKQYMKVYLEYGYDSKHFFEKFAMYIDELNKDSKLYKKISLNGFMVYLQGFIMDDYINNSLDEMGKLAEEAWKNKKGKFMIGD